MLGMRRYVSVGNSDGLHGGVFCGDFYSSYYCEDCHDWLVHADPEYFQDGIGFGDVKMAREEEARE